MDCCCGRDARNESFVVPKDKNDKNGAVLNALAASSASRDAKLKDDVPPAAKDLPPQSTIGELYVVVFLGKICVREYPDVTATVIGNLSCGDKVECFEWDNGRRWRRARVNRLVDDSDPATMGQVQESDGWVLIQSKEAGVMLELRASDTKGRVSAHSQSTAFSVNASSKPSADVAQTVANVNEERAAQEARLDAVDEDKAMARSLLDTTTQNGVEYVPTWCALTKVCYRVGDLSDPSSWQKVALAVDKFKYVQATVFQETWLKDKTNDYLLPLRHPQTNEALFVLMEPADSQQFTPPEQVIMCTYPPEGYPIMPSSAPPGGKWVEIHYIGPVTICCVVIPCCWPCAIGLSAMAGGKPLDNKTVYKAPDGKTYTEQAGDEGYEPPPS